MPFITSKASSGGSSSAISAATLLISSAEILALHASPITIVPAPGAHKANVPMLGTFAYLLGGSPYADGGTVLCGPVATVDDGQQLTLSSQSGVTNANVSRVNTNLADGLFPLSVYTDAALKVGVANQEFTGGDGTFRIAITYVTLDLT